MKTITNEMMIKALCVVLVFAAVLVCDRVITITDTVFTDLRLGLDFIVVMIGVIVTGKYFEKFDK